MSPRPPILFCDHRGERSEAVSKALQSLGLEVHRTSFLRSSLEALATLSPKLVVLDPLARQGLVEIRALDRARTHGSEPEAGQPAAGEESAALLVVGDRDQLPIAPGAPPLTALGGGPWDLIHADAPSEEWRLRVERLLEARVELTRNRALAHRASHDELTGLLRKDAFQQRLQEHFSAAQRHRFALALVLIDLDDFGLVNKRHDHVVGDRLIARVAEVIRGALRTEDVAGRLGGDEFAVVLPYTGKLDAAAVVNRLRDEIGRLSGRFPGAKSDIRVGSSIGFETYDGGDLASLEELRLHAERALRAAKERGGSQGVYFRSLPTAD